MLRHRLLHGQHAAPLSVLALESISRTVIPPFPRSHSRSGANASAPKRGVGRLIHTNIAASCAVEALRLTVSGPIFKNPRQA